MRECVLHISIKWFRDNTSYISRQMFLKHDFVIVCNAYNFRQNSNESLFTLIISHSQFNWIHICKKVFSDNTIKCQHFYYAWYISWVSCLNTDIYIATKYEHIFLFRRHIRLNSSFSAFFCHSTNPIQTFHTKW